MQIASQKADLILEDTKTITNTDWLGFQWSHLFWYPVIGEKSYFWSPRVRERNLQEKMICRLVGIIKLTGINYLLTYFFDTLGIGDNKLFFLRKPY